MRDLAIVVKKDVLADNVLNAIKKACRSNITNVELFDVYTGENVASDEKSLAFNITFEDRNKTLEAEEVEGFVQAILKKLEKDFNARLR
jgi:phenylalanyl-tRNA synthetase beta chain